MARLEERTQGIPDVIPTPATCLAPHAVDARPFALIHPPWFPADFDRLGAEYFQTQGFEVVHHGSAPLCSDYGEFHPTQVNDWAGRTVPDATEAVFIGGKGFRAISAIEALKEDLDRPVLSANQVTFWHALRLAGVRAAVGHYGQLFAKVLPPKA